MNRRPLGLLRVMKAIEGFLSFKSAEELPDRTLDMYLCQLEKQLEYLEDTILFKHCIKEPKNDQLT